MTSRRRAWTRLRALAILIAALSAACGEMESPSVQGRPLGVQVVPSKERGLAKAFFQNPEAAVRLERDGIIHRGMTRLAAGTVTLALVDAQREDGYPLGSITLPDVITFAGADLKELGIRTGEDAIVPAEAARAIEVLGSPKGNDKLEVFGIAHLTLAGDQVKVLVQLGFDAAKNVVQSSPDSPGECGDGSCGSGEDCSSCSSDCGTCTYCGDWSCNGSEDCSSCSSDCGSCFYCGDGSCNNGEDCSSCSSDCGSCFYCGDCSCKI